MDWLVKNIDSIAIIANIFTILGFLTVIFSLVQYFHSKKNLNFEVINQCLEKYNQWRKSDLTDSQKLKDYVEVVNLEFFYFQHNYLPIEIAYEWIDGIVDVLPFVNEDSINLNPEIRLVKINSTFEKFNYEKYLAGLTDYPRIKIAFNFNEFQKYLKTQQSLERLLIGESDHFDKIRIVKKILKNLKIIKFYSIIKHYKLNQELRIFKQIDKKYSLKNRIKFAFQTLLFY